MDAIDGSFRLWFGSGNGFFLSGLCCHHYSVDPCSRAITVPHCVSRICPAKQQAFCKKSLCPNVIYIDADFGFAVPNQ